MSFNNSANKVLNPQLPLHVRRSALRSCIQRFTWLSKESYTGITARYEAQLDLTDKRLTEYHLLKALSAMVTDRNLIVENLRAFERKRIREKRSGRRTLSNIQQKELLEIAYSVLK